MCECFFVAQRALHVGLIPALNSFTKILSDLGKEIAAEVPDRNERLLKELNGVREPSVPAFSSFHHLSLSLSLSLSPPLTDVHVDGDLLSARSAAGPGHSPVLHHPIRLDHAHLGEMHSGTQKFTTPFNYILPSFLFHYKC